MSVLLSTKQIARAAYLEVAYRDLKARAELGVVAYRLESLGGDLVHSLVLGIGEISIRAS